MNVFTFVFLTVCVVMVASVAEKWIKQRGERPGLDEDAEATLARVTELEERVQVLERIVTENRVDLKQEIDRL